MNKYGWSPYSSISYILAAQVPSKPVTPILTSATDSDLVIAMNLNVDNGGSPILDYTLEIDDGTLSSTFNTYASYTGILSTHTFNQLTDSLTTGKVYRLKIKARNALGSSDYSNILTVALTNAPLAPATLTRVESSSTKT